MGINLGTRHVSPRILRGQVIGPKPFFTIEVELWGRPTLLVLHHPKFNRSPLKNAWVGRGFIYFLLGVGLFSGGRAVKLPGICCVFSPYLLKLGFFVGFPQKQKKSDLWAATVQFQAKFRKKTPCCWLQSWWWHVWKRHSCGVNTPFGHQPFNKIQKWTKKKHPNPRKLTWNLKIPLWKRRKSYKPPIFGFHVSFAGGNAAICKVYTSTNHTSNQRKPVENYRFKWVKLRTVSMSKFLHAFRTCWNLSP